MTQYTSAEIGAVLDAAGAAKPKRKPETPGSSERALVPPASSKSEPWNIGDSP